MLYCWNRTRNNWNTLPCNCLLHLTQQNLESWWRMLSYLLHTVRYHWAGFAHAEEPSHAIIGGSFSVTGITDGVMVIFSSHIHHALLSRSLSAAPAYSVCLCCSIHWRGRPPVMHRSCSTSVWFCFCEITPSLAAKHTQCFPNSDINKLITHPVQAKLHVNALESQNVHANECKCIQCKPTHTPVELLEARKVHQWVERGTVPQPDGTDSLWQASSLPMCPLCSLVSASGCGIGKKELLFCDNSIILTQ